MFKLTFNRAVAETTENYRRCHWRLLQAFKDKPQASLQAAQQLAEFHGCTPRRPDGTIRAARLSSDKIERPQAHLPLQEASFFFCCKPATDLWPTRHCSQNPKPLQPNKLLGDPAQVRSERASRTRGQAVAVVSNPYHHPPRARAREALAPFRCM